jgi:hypothetical protein
MTPPSPQTFDTIIIGAGAAGLMCAIEAGKRGRRVALLDHADEIGKKILISGGGRCNFTNLHCTAEDFISSNLHFAKSALARYSAADFIALVEQHHIPYHEKTLGQLFCDRSARDITNMLAAECASAGVQIILDCSVSEVRRSDEFIIETSRGEFRAPSLVIATGGLSIPKMGATDFGYLIARQFGLRIQECRPALAPFTLSEPDRRRYCDLAGVATEAIVSTGKRRFQEKLLITHRGLSGPVILQISSYWPRGEEISIDLLPGIDFLAALLDRKQDADGALVRHVLSEFLPNRLAERWCELLGEERALNHISDRDLERISEGLHHWKLKPSGTEGYEKAEVTAGGVHTDELSSKTMESRKVPGLFFIGEVVDVTGHLGGFNFQWAWSSGYCAGQAV